ncbi:MAG: DUF3604 domain-containing protein [Candidatus Coatesbacteria bacterium]|nr:MAG: DUF3604 domain-containing protein [Candidatus Coatesbacteria bacterium]
MKQKFVLTVVALMSIAAAAGAGEAKPWVKVKPDVLPAGAVIPRITFEVTLPAETPVGSLLEIEIPYHFGFPQTGDPDADNYLSGDGRFVLGAERLLGRSYLIRGFAKEKLTAGKKIKLYLTREHTPPFDSKEPEFKTRLLGLPGKDGEREPLAEGVTTAVQIPAGPPARFRVVAPTCVTPGETFTAKIAVLDKNNNPAPSPWKGNLTVAAEGVTGNRTAEITKADDNYVAVPGYAVSTPGVYRLAATGGGLAGTSNPIVCREKWDRRIYWGDEHGHSAFSDGMRQPDEFFDYGRYVGLLDAAFLTDHAENLFENEWPTSVGIANAKHDPPEFVTLLGYEWTSDAWSGGYGHRCVFLRGDKGPCCKSGKAKSDTPAELAAKYKPGNVVMIPHHTLGGFRWDHFNPAYDRCVEIVSHWGCSEYAGNPFWKNREWPGGGVVAALDSYYLFGFVGGGDNHNGAPGQNHGPSRFRHMPYYGGITAFLVEENTREALFEALYDRRVYATAGNRDFLDFRVDGAPMASVVPVGAGAPLVEVEVATENPLRSVEVVRGGETVYAAPAAAGEDYLQFSWPDEGYDGAPTYYYLRVTSEDGHLAFATPVWVAGGAWFAGGTAGEEETWAPGEEKALPAPPSAGFKNYALRLDCAADAPGTLTVVAGNEAAAVLEVPPGENVLTTSFSAAGKWDLRLVYDGPSPLRLREACVFPYPWREPRPVRP